MNWPKAFRDVGIAFAVAILLCAIITTCSFDIQFK